MRQKKGSTEMNGFLILAFLTITILVAIKFTQPSISHSL